ncbi:hypothetical protein [Accumulibacter sp.]|nr:hypothetical protein [Accumulibacter sp.]
MIWLDADDDLRLDRSLEKPMTHLRECPSLLSSRLLRSVVAA